MLATSGPSFFILDSKFFAAVLILIVGFFLVALLGRVVGRYTAKKLTPHHSLIVKKIVSYLGAFLVITTVLIQLEVNLTAFLGAAGIASIAISFASQTSLSNLISGLFLLSEKPFQTGDVILVNGTRGVVLSIDLLSVKLRTLDNIFVRIPNETLIKTEVQNITRFPIRRMDINLGVAYKEDVGKVMSILREIADRNPYSLDEPEPLLLFKDFGSSSLELLLGLWFEKTNFLKLKNSVMQEIKKRFDEEGIEIPFPHVTVYSGSETKPFPLQINKESEEGLKD